MGGGEELDLPPGRPFLIWNVHTNFGLIYRCKHTHTSPDSQPHAPMSKGMTKSDNIKLVPPTTTRTTPTALGPVASPQVKMILDSPSFHTQQAIH